MKNEISQYINVRVSAKCEEAQDIASFELVACDGGSLPVFAAGSHIDVKVSESLTRQYSLCNSPAETHRYVIAVQKEPSSRGGSKAMHETVKVGDTLTIGAPKNNFRLAHDAERHLLLAGGIGITPILCMAESLAIREASFELHLCTRSIDRTAFRERIAGSHFSEKVHFHFDDGVAEQKFDMQRQLAQSQSGTHLYVCGPKGFMDAVLSSARAGGWPEHCLHYEFFSAEPVSADSDEGFELQLASSGRIVAVRKGQTALEALTEAGIEVASSCEQGVCGTCATRVLVGIPDHRDLYFTAEQHAANDQFTPCCSRAKTTRLVLDL
ncbi:vanillate O-demethylase ferredoxin subunit [Variovorax sp. PDC80]|uniref:PDR/VanB family oxidoreductase n=1 Tax=Variovorax sp. PDC80 TaxID=1882827 RepID=UPI0008E036EE|nr:PDR/VanB family oxidoreductase [Variovorax sp. PDC80]SFN98926.1 vanillate O-demethylase ferredoxin subunit [Variovorax sp. PDC80]